MTESKKPVHFPRFLIGELILATDCFGTLLHEDQLGVVLQHLDLGRGCFVRAHRPWTEKLTGTGEFLTVQELLLGAYTSPDNRDRLRALFTPPTDRPNCALEAATAETLEKILFAGTNSRSLDLWIERFVDWCAVALARRRPLLKMGLKAYGLQLGLNFYSPYHPGDLVPGDHKHAKLVREIANEIGREMTEEDDKKNKK